MGISSFSFESRKYFGELMFPDLKQEGVYNSMIVEVSLGYGNERYLIDKRRWWESAVTEFSPVGRSVGDGDDDKDMLIQCLNHTF